MAELEVRHYLTPSRRDVVDEWLASMRDRRAVAAILLRIGRIGRGLFGDCKSVGDGVQELRIDIGPGYRVYFGSVGDRLIILLCGGDKRGQRGDIDKAKQYWADYARRAGTQ
jgi:putative addiction module killer protein